MKLHRYNRYAIIHNNTNTLIYMIVILIDSNITYITNKSWYGHQHVYDDIHITSGNMHPLSRS